MDAPWGSVEIDDADELQGLRRRAYGPEADIAGDASAQARLAQLEAAQRGALHPVVDIAETAVDTGQERVEASVVDHVPAPEPVHRQIADSGSVSAAGSAPWWRSRRWAMIGVLAAVLALNAGLVAWIAAGSTPGRSDTSVVQTPSVPAGQARGYLGPAPDDVLALESVGAGVDAPNDRHGILDALGISADELRRYEDFAGLSVWSGKSRNGMTCLFVASRAQGLREGSGGEGCSLQGLDTIADVQMPTASNLTRFVLRADRVHVYEYVRTAYPDAPRG